MLVYHDNKLVTLVTNSEKALARVAHIMVREVGPTRPTTANSGSWSDRYRKVERLRLADFNATMTTMLTQLELIHALKYMVKGL